MVKISAEIVYEVNSHTAATLKGTHAPAVRVTLAYIYKQTLGLLQLALQYKCPQKAT